VRFQPRLGVKRVRANQKHLLHRPRSGVQALEPGIRRVLHLETRRRLAASYLDSAGDDPRDVRAVFDDEVEDLVEPADAPVLSLDLAELHRGEL
jgi:hypothetical protein